MPSWPLKLLCLFALVACTPAAHAQVYRCIGAHGEPVFSGQPCGNPAPPPGSTAQGSDGFGAVCAASPMELREGIADAFFRHDVNRLAGMLLWQGFSQGSARATLQSLAEWLRQPLIGIAVAYATGPPDAGDPPVPATALSPPAGATSTGPPVGFEVSTGGGNGSTRTFGIVETEGCWWLTF